MKKLTGLAILFALIAPTQIQSQVSADRDLLNEISKIKAIDNHAHPLKYVAPGEKPDDEYDALPLEAIEAFPLPVRLNPANAEFIHAWHDLYGYSHKDMSDAHIADLMKTKERTMSERADSFPAWALDQLNIETMFANRVAMGRGLAAPRFRWVAFDDALIFPLNNEAAKRSNRDYKAFYPGEERLLKRYLTDLKVGALPATLDQYLKRVVTPTLERQKRNGAIAIKFEAAYLRKLDFDDPDEAKSWLTYARYVRGGEPSANAYKSLQDYLFYYIARGVDDWAWPCTFTASRAPAASIDRAVVIQAFWKLLSTIRACARRTLSSSTAVIRSPKRWANCSASPMSMRTFPRKLSSLIRAS